MANMKYNPSGSHNGKITYNTSIVEDIVSLAIREVDGVEVVEGKRGIRLNFEKEGVYADVSVVATYGNNVPHLAFRIQQSVKQAVESMTKYKIVNINVTIQDVKIELQKDNESKIESKVETIEETNQTVEQENK